MHENHKDRPEIAEAFSTGNGQSIRTSTTINKSNYYYAVLLKNGNVLRVAKETRSIMNIFFSVLPVILLIMLLFFEVVGAVSSNKWIDRIFRVAMRIVEGLAVFCILIYPFLKG